ncbi:FadR/GntR family transcriptional regulator [Micromonospora sp. DPT]|uniref:FadR/GntR family transcriptional regulator n=1 Tax=Micromonospora sp. DPT TaxID=3142975 RepID=UPI00320AA046
MNPGQSGTADVLAVNKVLPAYEQVAEQLRQLILKGELAPGDRLPVEGDLCAVFGVSRSTIREALRVLAARDLVHTVRGTTGGTFVSRTDAAKVSQYLETSLGLMSGADAITVAEILEARELVEVPAARLASSRATPGQIEAMREALNREVASMGRGLKFREHRNFHGIIVEAAGNGLLKIMNDPVFKVLQAKFLRPDVAPEFWHKVDSEHGAILDCIAGGDADGAAKAMLDHLATLRVLYQD